MNSGYYTMRDAVADAKRFGKAICYVGRRINPKEVEDIQNELGSDYSVGAVGDQQNELRIERREKKNTRC